MATGDKPGGGLPKLSTGPLLAVVAALLVLLLATFWYALAATLFFGGENPLLVSPSGPICR